MKNLRIDVEGCEITLEGRMSTDGAVGAVVAPPHPLYGGHLSNPVVGAIMAGLARRSITALAFNWRGIGTSGGNASGELEPALADYRAALAHARRMASPAARPLVAAGYSFGAAVALAAALGDHQVEEIVLVAAPMAMLPAKLEAVGRPALFHVIAAEHDAFAAPDELRKAFACLDARMTVIAGADHFFSFGGLEKVVEAVAAGG